MLPNMRTVALVTNTGVPSIVKDSNPGMVFGAGFGERRFMSKRSTTPPAGVSETANPTAVVAVNQPPSSNVIAVHEFPSEPSGGTSTFAGASGRTNANPPADGSK